jgi:amino acid transporter/signal transduction histidine kinase
MLSASAIQSWFLPSVPTSVLACAIIAFFTFVNLCGVKWITRLTIPIGVVSAGLAFLSAVIPVWAGKMDWHQAISFHLVVPFGGWFGKVTSAMAGLYLVGFAAPAFEAAVCHVGETRDAGRNVPRAMFASAVMATLYFLVLPIVWLGTIGSDAMAGDLAQTLGPTFGPLFGGAARAAATGFMMFNMFHGTIAPLTGVCRTLSQLADDGLLPECFSLRMKRTDAPWVAIGFTAALAMGGVLINDPIWFIAAANFTYLIGISLPSVAVWLLRKDMPDHPRLYRAPRGTIMLGLIAALGWGISTILGFEQFGLRTVILGIGLAYSGSILYAWRKWSDHRKAGSKGVPHSLHVKLTGAMMLVLVFDGAGYLLAVHSAGAHGTPMIAALEDIFVIVALLTITVGLVLPGMIAHSAVEVRNSARALAEGTLADFSKAMEALAAGNLDAAHARVDIRPVLVHSRDEVGQMAESFNTMQEEVKRAACGLDGAREGLRKARRELEEINASLEQRVMDRTAELESAHKKLVDAAWQAGMAEVAIGVLHNVGNVLNSVNVSASVVEGKVRKSRAAGLAGATAMIRQHEANLAEFLTQDERGKQLPGYLLKLSDTLAAEQQDVLGELASLTKNVDHIKQIISTQQSFASASALREQVDLRELAEDAIRVNLIALDRHQVKVERQYQEVPTITVDRHKVLQIIVNLISNAKWAVIAGSAQEKRVCINIGKTPAGGGFVEIVDTGIGISTEDLPRIFEHGFTRREGGHGYGLHSAAVAAKSMGGSLKATSAGAQAGATFILELPAEQSPALAA